MSCLQVLATIPRMWLPWSIRPSLQDTSATAVLARSVTHTTPTAATIPTRMSKINALIATIATRTLNTPTTITVVRMVLPSPPSFRLSLSVLHFGASWHVFAEGGDSILLGRTMLR